MLEIFSQSKLNITSNLNKARLYGTKRREFNPILRGKTRKMEKILYINVYGVDLFLLLNGK